MNWKNLKIYQKLAIGFGSVILLLILISVGAIFTLDQFHDRTEAVNELQHQVAFMVEKEVDHLHWMADVNALFNDDKITSLAVETDDHKCSLGQWLYSTETAQHAQNDPEFATHLKALEEPHNRLHQSAISINNSYKNFDLSLRGLLAEIWIKHLDWLNLLQTAIQTNFTFSGTLDPHQCAFGKWYYSYKTDNPTFAGLLKQWEEPHNRLHQSGAAIAKLIEEGDMTEAGNIYAQQTLPALDQLKTRWQETATWINTQSQGQMEALNIFQQTTLPAVHETQEVLGGLEAHLGEQADLLDTQAEAANTRANRLILLVSSTAILIGLGMSWLITKTITNPIQKTVYAAKQMAKGNFNEKMDINQKDEFGQMSDALNLMIDNVQDKVAVADRVAEGDLRTVVKLASDEDQLGLSFQRMVTDLTKMVGNIQTNAGNLASSSEEMAAVSNQLSSGSEEMSTQADNVAGASEEMTNNITNMATTTEEMSANINNMASGSEQISQNMQTVAAAVEEMNTSISDIANHAQEGVAVSNQAEQMSATATTTMGALGEAASEIGQVTEVIKRIAEQTNLLALNATIEAASAGEAGKGFAVVANEIKELANQSAQAAEDIANRIGGVQNNTKEAVEVISKVAEIIAKLKESSTTISAAVEEQGRTVSEISTNVGEVNVGTTNIASSVAEMATGASDVSQNAGEAAKAVGDVASNVSEVSLAAQETNKGSQQIKSAAEELTMVAEGLNELVSSFKIQTA